GTALRHDPAGATSGSAAGWETTGGSTSRRRTARSDPAHAACPGRQDQHVAAPDRCGVRLAAPDDGAALRDLRRWLRERDVPYARRPEPHTEPVEGTVVLPRSARAAALLPPAGRGRDAAAVQHPRPDGVAVHRPQPVVASTRPQTRDRALHAVHLLLGNPRDPRVVLPGAGIQLRLPMEGRTFL